MSQGVDPPEDVQEVSRRHILHDDINEVQCCQRLASMIHDATPENKNVLISHLDDFVQALKQNYSIDVPPGLLATGGDAATSIRQQEPDITMVDAEITSNAEAHPDADMFQPTQNVAVEKRRHLSSDSIAQLEDTESVESEGDARQKRRRISQRRQIKPLQFTKRVEGPDDWKEVSLAMSQEITVAKLGELRKQFYNDLRTIPMPAGSKHRRSIGPEDDPLFDRAHAAQMTNFFFEDVMGVSGQQQLKLFVTQYSGENQLDLGAATRATKIVHDEGAPDHIRRFFAAYGADVRGDSGNSNSAVKHIEQVTRSIRTLHEYQKVCRCIDNDDKDIRAYLANLLVPEELEKLMEKGQGVSVPSVARRVLGFLARADHGSLNSRCDRAKSINIVLEKMGEPALLLMPASSMTFLKDMGVARVTAACDKLLELCPWIPTFTAMLDPLVWQPYKAGEPRLPIDISCIGDGHAGGFIEHVRDAGQQFHRKRIEEIAPTEER